MAELKEVGNALEQAMGTGGIVYVSPDVIKSIIGSGGSDKTVIAKFQSNGRDAIIRVSKPTTGIAGGMTFYYWADGKAIEPKVTIEDGNYLIMDKDYGKDFYNPYASDWKREKITKRAIYAGIVIAVLVIAIIIKRKRRK